MNRFSPKILVLARISVGLAVSSPWLLLLVSENIRGEFAVIFLPLTWSLVFLVENVSFGRAAAWRKRVSKQGGSNE